MQCRKSFRRSLIIYMFLREHPASMDLTPSEHGLHRADRLRHCTRRSRHIEPLVFRRRAACAARNPNPVLRGAQHDRKPLRNTGKQTEGRLCGPKSKPGSIHWRPAVMLQAQSRPPSGVLASGRLCRAAGREDLLRLRAVEWRPKKNKTGRCPEVTKTAVSRVKCICRR
jgi:hypothetical protein